MSAPDSVDKILRIPLREAWKHEAQDFSRWLADNMDVVSEATKLELSLQKREAPAGDFSVDLIAETSNGETVVIEIQLGKSDHDHLGKVLTYVAAYEAPIAIWIVGDARPEHIKAVAWLNDSAQSVSVYLLRAEAIRIGASKPALLLSLVIGPSEEAKVVAKEKQEQSERHKLRKEFWTALLQQAAGKTTLHAGVSASTTNWIGTSAGRSGLALNYVVREDDWRVELYIDVGDADRNEAIFNYFHKGVSAIESKFGAALEWQRLDEKRACRITTPWREGGYRSPVDGQKALHSRMIDAMIRFESALRPGIEKLPSGAALGAKQTT